MIKFENTEVMGWEHAIRGMRNPMNSWDKSDSLFMDENGDVADITGNGNMYYECWDDNGNALIGANDLKLMKNLIKAGTDHRKFMRMITVYVDITAPLYWWKEFDTYKVGTVANSCSTMHKIHEKEFTVLDFSEEHLLMNMPDEKIYDSDGNVITMPANAVLGYVICNLNIYRKLYLKTKDKKYWWQMIQLLPSSYNQKRTVMLNYEVLANIYKSRKNHKLDEWNVGFINWIEELPYSQLITGKWENN